MKETFSVNDLIAKIKDPDDKVRSAAWSAAGRVGAPAVKPLAAVATDPVSELEIGRSAAKRRGKAELAVRRRPEDGNGGLRGTHLAKQRSERLVHPRFLRRVRVGGVPIRLRDGAPPEATGQARPGTRSTSVR